MVAVDTVTLTLPRGAGYLALLHLVLGGIALRKDLSFDDLDDVQLAVDSILAEDPGRVGDVEMKVSLEEEGLRIRLAAFSNQSMKASLGGSSRSPAPEPQHLDMGVLLESLCDSFVVEDLRGDCYAIELWKRTG